MTTATQDTPTDICPRCTTTPIEIELHGPTAGAVDRHDPDPSWYCQRCRLLAVDLDNAREYASFLSVECRPGRVVDRLLKDAEEGRPVDALMLARAHGRLWAHYGPHRQLCEMAWLIASHIEPRSPWSIAPAQMVAEMIVAALRAAWIDIVDTLDVLEVFDAREAGREVPDLPELDDDERRHLAAQVVELAEEGGPNYAAAIGRLFAFGYLHATRDDAAIAVLAAIVAELRDDANLLGDFDGENARAIQTALAAAGFALTYRCAR